MDAPRCEPGRGSLEAESTCMTVNRTELWQVIEGLVKEAGLELFDLDVPAGGRGTLRVFLWRGRADSSEQGEGARGAGGVGISDCARISKQITNLPNIDELLPGEWLIEVSSPGINRRLVRPDHFAGAVGERVRLTVAGAENRSEVVTGRVVGCSGTSVEVDAEETQARRVVPLEQIRQARVDFVFE